MKRSSLGFHTFTIFVRLTSKEARRIYRAFEVLRKSNVVTIIPYGKRTVLKFNGDNSTVYKGFNIEYIERTGVSWTLRFSNQSPDHKTFTLEATINPKILSGILDYITAANEDDMQNIPNLLNQEIRRISTEIPSLGWFKFKRIDYCVNFDLEELGIPCTSQQMMSLIKRSNIPYHYKEWTEYDPIGHRHKSDNISFRLESKSVTAHFYDKYEQLKRQYPDNPSLEYAKNILRFEVQCYYNKVYGMTRAYEKNLNELTKFDFRDLFSKESCEAIIKQYFDRIIMRGNYYPLKHATRKIIGAKFRNSMTERLIGVLNLVNPKGGGGSIAKAKSLLTGTELEDFKRGLLQLQDVAKINPVVIPGNWGINFIPNLFDAYRDLHGIERFQNTSYNPFDDE